MGEAGFERAGANGCYADGVRRAIVPVVAVDLFETAAELALILRAELLVRFAEFRAGPFGEDETGFAMQPVGCPIWRNVTAMAPDGADFHTAERLPDVLAAADVTIGDNNGAIGVDDTSGEGRHLLINASADPPQD